jgi:uncharacterized protein YfaS (alpha-2-macroglobulin family)
MATIGASRGATKWYRTQNLVFSAIERYLAEGSMRAILASISVLVVTMLFGCHGSGGGGVLKLTPVAAVPPPQLPAWIASVSPVKEAATLSQIRIIFNKPITGVGSLEGNGPAAVLSHLQIEPALRGNFVVYTPRMIGFVAEQALPVGTRVRVTLTPGLRDLAGDTLERALVWTFETQPLGFTDLPTLGENDDGDTPAPSNLHPTLQVTANAAVDTQSLAAHAALVSGGTRIPLDAQLQAQPTPMPGSGATEAFDPSLDTWVYNLTPRATLARSTTYRLVIAAGVEPANGNVTTARSYAGAIRTYSPLSIVATPSPQPGTFGNRFARGDPVVTFNNPLDPKTLAGNVTISPAPASSANPAAISQDSPNVVGIDAYLLAPRTHYTIAIGTGLADAFGQHLAAPQTIAVDTGDFTPGIWAPSQSNVFPNVTDIAIDIYATNLPGNAYRADYLPLTPAMLVVNGDDPSSLLPNASRWPRRPIAGARPNVQSAVRVPLRALLGGNSGTLAYGVGATLGPDDVQTYDGIVSLTNLGVIVQTFPSRAIVRVARLSDGSPVAGASVSLYRTGNAPSTAPCALGTTGADGVAEIAGPPLEACYGGGASYAGEAPPVMAVARDGADWAYARVNGWSGTENMGDLDTNWQSGAPLSRGTIFSDRQMYQPGENARITGIAYAVRNGVLAADANVPYDVTLTDPRGATRSLGTVRTDAFGVFSLPITFGPNQPLGYYGIAAKGRGNEIDGGLRVAQFKPPNFKLDVTLDRQTAIAGSTVNATARASYLFGAPLSHAAAKIDVTRQPATLAPQGWDDYTFGRQWFWPDQQPEIDTDVLSTTGTFDGSGTLAQQVNVAGDLPFPMTYSIDVQATDVSNLSVDTTQSFTALASDGIIGLKTDLVGQAGQPLAVQVIVTDTNGTPISGRSVHLDLQSMTYTAATQAVAGGESAQNGVQYTTVDGADVTSSNAPVTVQLHPKDAGPYRIRANFGGAPAGSETDLQAFVVGSSEVDWGNQNPTSVTVTLDKKHYTVGETARALVASPFARSDIYFAVVRQDVLLSRLVHASGNGPTISFRVTPAMLPNAAVEAIVVRRGPSIAKIASGSLDSLLRVGFTPLHVDLSGQYLNVTIAAQHARLAPGSLQRVTLHVHRGARPARGEAVVIVADDAILQLTGYRPPDLVQTIFADQPISTRYSDNRANVALTMLAPTAEKGWGYGGGFLIGSGSTRVRRQFRPLAFYRIVSVDANGNASVAFKIPDELTTWRVMAVALGSDDMHFGNGDATFVATQTLLTNPLLPQFARPGDTIDAGLSALDVAGGGTLALHGELTGSLSFASGSPRSVDDTAALGTEMQALRFPMNVGTPAPTSVFFSSRIGSATDAFRVPFTVRDRTVTESVVDAGATSAQSVVPVDFSGGGSVGVTLANSVVPQFGLPAGDAMAADPQPFLDDAASRLIIASATLALAPRYHLHVSFDATAAARAALAAILALQQEDGGFAYFKGGVSDPFESAYAVEALAFARDRGTHVDVHAIDNATAYLERTLLNPTRYAWCRSALCLARMRLQMLLALDALGRRRNDFLSAIVAQQQNFDSTTRIRLARYLLRVPGYRALGTALADSLDQSVYRTGRYATFSASDPWGWLGTPVEGQAQMVRLLVERGASADEVDGALRALVAQQCRCGWGTLAGTASAVEALSEYAAHERLVPFAASVSAGTRTIATVRFNTTASSQTLVLPASSIAARQLTFSASGGGTLHYALLYTYPIAKNAPGELAGLRVIRTVRAAGSSAALATMDLAPLSSPVALNAGDVVDVGVQVIVDHPVDRLVIEDPLPAGLEAVDEALRTSSSTVLAQSDSWQIENQQIYADRVTAYASHLEPGIYEIHYLARAVTPGTYRWPGARAYLRDAPEEFGRSAFATLDVR